MRYPESSGDKANHNIRCVRQCKSAVFELSKGNILIPSRHPMMHQCDLMKITNDGIIQKMVEYIKEYNGQFPYVIPLGVNTVLSAFGGTKTAFGAHTDGGRYVNYTSLEKYKDSSTKSAVQKAIPYVGFQFTVTIFVGNGSVDEDTMLLKWKCI